MAMKDLSIRKTDEGHFVIVQIDRVKKQEIEKHRSRNLEEVVERFFDRNELSVTNGEPIRDYAPVLEIIKSLPQKYPSLYDEGIPANWTDPLELYGCIGEELIRFEANLDQERREVADLVFYNGPEWVWKNRYRLVAERVFFLSSDDWQKVQTEVS